MGLIFCAEREDSLSFNFADLVPPYRQPYREHEVSFAVVPDPRQPGRLFAADIEQLPRGSLQWEEIVQKRAAGVISRELRGQQKPRHFDRRAGGAAAGRGAQQQEMIGGKVKLEGSEELLEFAERDLVDSSVLPQVGDIVEFDVFMEKRSKRRGATHLRISQFNPSDRVQGRVAAVKEGGFGFVKCAEADRSDVYFRLVDVIGKQHVERDDELEFNVVVDERGRASASRITKLPKGTIKVETLPVVEEKHVGVVEKELELSPSFTPSEGSASETAASPAPGAGGAGRRVGPEDLVNGCIRITTADSPLNGQLVRFSGRDVWAQPVRAGAKPSRRTRLLVGDTVTFQVHQRSGTAARVSKISPTANSALNREVGVVTKVVDSYCFIDSPEREVENLLFMHMSELNDPSVQVAVGTELEFNVIADMVSQKLSAIRAQVVPKGTVQYAVTLPATYSGVVVKASKRMKKEQGQGREMRDREGDRKSAVQYSCGVIKLTGDVPEQLEKPRNGTDHTIVYFRPEVAAGSPQVLAGDLVSFSVKVDKRTRRTQAVAVKLTQMAPDKRQKAVVAETHEDFGRLRCLDRKELLDFDYSDIVDVKFADIIRPNDCVEFNLLKTTDQGAKPIRLTHVPRGSAGAVEVETIDNKTRLRATVVSVPRRVRARGETLPGTVKIISDKEEEALVLPFQTFDLPKQLRLQKDDVVTVCVATLKFDPTVKRAVNVHPEPKEGTVKDIPAGPASPGVIVLNSAEPEEVVFYTRDVLGKVTLKKGDVVSVGSLVFRPSSKGGDSAAADKDKDQRRVAKEIKRLREAPAESKQQPASAAAAGTAAAGAKAGISSQRVAKGPDSGSKGFGGRRKPDAKPKAQAADRDPFGALEGDA